MAAPHHALDGRLRTSPNVSVPEGMLAGARLLLLLLQLLLRGVSLRSVGTTTEATQPAVSCDEFLRMKVLEEVRALGQGRVPRECRDRKLEHQRREPRRHAAARRGGGGAAAGPAGPEYEAIAGRMRPLRELLRRWPVGRAAAPEGYRMPLQSLCARPLGPLLGRRQTGVVCAQRFRHAGARRRGTGAPPDPSLPRRRCVLAS